MGAGANRSLPSFSVSSAVGGSGKAPGGPGHFYPPWGLEGG
jgi:hypothetical protein